MYILAVSSYVGGVHLGRLNDKILIVFNGKHYLMVYQPRDNQNRDKTETTKRLIYIYISQQKIPLLSIMYCDLK